MRIIEKNNNAWPLLWLRPFPRPRSSTAPPPPFLGCRVGCHGNDHCGFTSETLTLGTEAAPRRLELGPSLRRWASCQDPTGL